MRLHLKISLWTVAILVVVGGISVYALYAFQRRASIQQFEVMAHTLKTTILNSLEITMVRNNQEEMREIIRLIKREEMIRDVTIYSREGRVWASSGVRTGVPAREADAFQRAAGGHTHLTVEDQGAGELVVLTPVFNKQACHACHAADPPVLGVISVSLWTVPIASQLRRSAQLLAALVAFTFLLALGTLSLLLGRLVLDPLAAMVTAVRQVAGGQYSARVAVRGRDELGVLAGSVNEMAERIDHYTAALNTQIGDLTERLASLGICGRALTGASDLSAVMDDMTRGLRDVLRADMAAVYLHEDGLLRLTCRSGEGFLPDQVLFGEGAVGGAAAMRRSVQMSNTELGAVLAAPLLIKDSLLGVLVVARQSAWPFVEADASLMATLSNQLAITMENVRLFEEVRTKEAHRGELLSKLITAHEDERRRIARELHDEVSQSLTGLLMGITAAESLRDSAMVRQRLNAIYASTEATLEEVRKIIYDLRPTALDDLGMVSAVRAHARDLLETAGVVLSFDASGFGHRRLSAAVETTVFRVAQEAITNIARHAKARSVAVRLTLKGGILTLIVEDDGVGFDLAGAVGRPQDRRMGILGMQERAVLIGGELRIDSRPGHGTRVELTARILEGEA
jgi:signal transduction histidine kinase